MYCHTYVQCHMGTMAECLTRVSLMGEMMSCMEECASVSYMVQRTRASHYRVHGILRTLVQQGLAEQIGGPDGRLYGLSSRGRDFLREYQSFRRYSESVGMAV